MRVLKVLAVLSALGFLSCVVAYGSGGSLGSTKSGRLPRATGRLESAPAKDAGPPRDVYMYSTKAGPLALPDHSPPPQQQRQAP